MYENIGKLIKRLALVGSFIIGLLLFVLGIVFINEPKGIILMISGPVGGWLLSVFTYGFGELIDKTSYIAKYLERKEDERRSKI
jgi:hypothetical protein